MSPVPHHLHRPTHEIPTLLPPDRWDGTESRNGSTFPQVSENLLVPQTTTEIVSVFLTVTEVQTLMVTAQATTTQFVAATTIFTLARQGTPIQTSIDRSSSTSSLSSSNSSPPSSSTASATLSSSNFSPLASSTAFATSSTSNSSSSNFSLLSSSTASVQTLTVTAQATTTQFVAATTIFTLARQNSAIQTSIGRSSSTSSLSSSNSSPPSSSTASATSSISNSSLLSSSIASATSSTSNPSPLSSPTTSAASSTSNSSPLSSSAAFATSSALQRFPPLPSGGPSQVSAQDSTGSKLSSGGIVGITLSCVLFVILLGVCFIRLRSTRKREKDRTWVTPFIEEKPVVRVSVKHRQDKRMEAFAERWERLRRRNCRLQGQSNTRGAAPGVTNVGGGGRDRPPTRPQRHHGHDRVRRPPVPPVPPEHGPRSGPSSPPPVYRGPSARRPVQDDMLVSSLFPHGAVAKLHFEPNRPDELEVHPGDYLRVIALFDDGWAQCKAVTGQRGMVPTACLRINEVRRLIR